MLARTLLADKAGRRAPSVRISGSLEGKPADQARESMTRILLNAAWQHGRGKPKLAVTVGLRARISRAVVREEDVRQGIPFLCGVTGNSAQQGACPLPALKSEVSGAEKILRTATHRGRLGQKPPRSTPRAG